MDPLHSNRAERMFSSGVGDLGHDHIGRLMDSPIGQNMLLTFPKPHIYSPLVFFTLPVFNTCKYVNLLERQEQSFLQLMQSFCPGEKTDMKGRNINDILDASLVSSNLLSYLDFDLGMKLGIVLDKSSDVLHSQLNEYGLNPYCWEKDMNLWAFVRAFLHSDEYEFLVNSYRPVAN